MKKIVAVIVVILGIMGGFLFFFQEKDISYRQKQAVTELTCIKDDYAPTIKGLGKGLIVACSEEYDEQTDKNTSHIRIVDIMKDEILYHLDMDGSYNLNNVYQDQIIIANQQSNEFEFYDFQLNKNDSLKVDNLTGCFYNNQYYYLDQSALFVMDVKTKERQQVEVENDMRFGSLVTIEDHYLICYPFINHLSDNTCIGSIDLQDGSFDVLSDDYIDLQINHDFKVLKNDNEIPDGFFYTYTYNIDEQYYTTSDTSLATKYIDYIPYSQYFVDLSEQAEEDVQQSQTETTLYHLDQKIASCDLKDYGYSADVYGLTYLDEENLIVGYNQSIVIIDPTYLEFKEVDQAKSTDVELKKQKIIETYNEKEETTVQGLDKAKSKIKKLEETYNVEIFISSDCKKEYLQNSGFTFKDTSGYDDEENLILEALEDIEAGLKLYPEHFFDQFYTKAGDGGLKIYLVGKIESTYSVIAFEFESAYNQNVILDINNDIIKQTFCHEVWHGIENIALSKDDTIFDDWNELNPKGFQYTENFEGYDLDNNAKRYNFFDDNNMNIEDVYFIDTYSHTCSKEDRARVIEYMLAGDETVIKELSKSPHIMKKVEKLNDIIRKTFDISFEM